MWAAYPAVEVLPLLGFAHAADVGGEDHEEGRQHGVRLGPTGVLGEQAVHDGGALHDQPRHVLHTGPGHNFKTFASEMHRFNRLKMSQQPVMYTVILCAFTCTFLRLVNVYIDIFPVYVFNFHLFSVSINVLHLSPVTPEFPVWKE